MGLQAEIERFFRESQTWDLEMLARSALPSYHSNYPTSPLPPGASGGVNATVTASKKTSGDYWLTVDKDYYQVEKLVFLLVSDTDLDTIATRRTDSLKSIHGVPDYTKHLDDVTTHVEAAKAATGKKKKAEYHEAREHLRGEGNNFTIAIDLHSYTPPTTTPPPPTPAEKILIKFDGCHYVRQDYATAAIRDALIDEHGLQLPWKGFADRWPQWIVLKTPARPNEIPENTYKRADLIV